MFKKLAFVLLLVALCVTSCAPNAQEIAKAVVAAMPTQIPPVSAEEIGKAIAAALPTPISPATPVVEPPKSAGVESVSAAPAANSGSFGKCDPLAVTSLSQREDAFVNGTRVTLEVRDLTSRCERPLFYNETGVKKGFNYKLEIPQGWIVITASVTAEVQRDGKSAQKFLDTPIMVIQGPFTGNVGLYEGAIRVIPFEWLDAVLMGETLPIQRLQTGKPGLMPIYFSD